MTGASGAGKTAAVAALPAMGFSVDTALHPALRDAWIELLDALGLYCGG